MRKRDSGEPLKILLELSYAHREIGGAWVYIQRYLRSLFDMVSGKDGGERLNVRFYVRANDESVELLSDRTELPQEFWGEIEITLTGDEARSMLNRLHQEHIATPRAISNWDIDVVHWFGNHSCAWDWSSNNKDVMHFITVHDLLLFEESLTEPPNSRLIRRFIDKLKRQFHHELFIRDAGRPNRVFVPISDFTAGQLNKHIGHGNIHSNSLPVYTSVPVFYKDSPFSKEISSEEKKRFCKRYGISEVDEVKVEPEQQGEPEPCLLYVAHFYPHKNHLRLLEAYEAYRREDGKRSLVFRGDPIDQSCYQRVKNRVQTSDFREDIHFVPSVTAEEMHVLYAVSAGMIFPSRHEGGGIPVMESLFHARPVACSHLPVFEEYYGDIPHYLNPDDVNSIREGLHWIDHQWNLLKSNVGEQSRFLEQVEVVRQTFSKERMQRDLRRLYEEWVL